MPGRAPLPRVFAPAVRLILGGLALSCAAAQAQVLSLSVESVEHPFGSARGVSIELESPEAGRALVRIDRLRLGERELRGAQVRCARLRLAGGRIECSGGELSAGQAAPKIPLRFSYRADTRALDLVVEPGGGERWTVKTSVSRGAFKAELEVANADIARLAQWLPQAAGWKPMGRVNANAAWTSDRSGGRAEARMKLRELAFSDPAGTRAGEKLDLSFDLAADRDPPGWRLRGTAGWNAGEVFWQPWYFAQGGLEIGAEALLGERSVEIGQARARLKDVGELRLSGSVPLDHPAQAELRFASERIDLEAAGRLLLAPVLDQAAAPKLTFAGMASVSGSIGGGALREIDLGFTGVSVSEATGRFGISGVDGPLAWKASGRTGGVLRVGGASLGRLALGGFELPYAADGWRFEVPEVRVPVLDGQIVVDKLDARRDEAGRWAWTAGGSLYPVSMLRLTEALGLPRMSGTMSASLPELRFADSTLALGGALIIQVFDGYAAVTDLRLADPLGRVPQLFADMEMRHIDLGQLTETFSFGRMTGFVDGYVKGLEMAGWRPHRFDALVISSPGDYPRRISQRAVEDISALGGAGAAAAVQRSVLRVFRDFGYAKLGLSCALRDGVCEMGGVEPAPQGYVIVKGGGVPAITVMGYNRRVDWDELLARLKRISQGNAGPVIR
jgi:hypothetical protein